MKQVYIYIELKENKIDQIVITNDNLPDHEVIAKGCVKYGPYFNFRSAIYQLQTEIVYYYNE